MKERRGEGRRKRKEEKRNEDGKREKRKKKRREGKRAQKKTLGAILSESEFREEFDRFREDSAVAAANWP